MGYKRINICKFAGEIVHQEKFKLNFDFRTKIYCSVIFYLKISDMYIIPCLAINNIAEKLFQEEPKLVYIKSSVMQIKDNMIYFVEELKQLKGN